MELIDKEKVVTEIEKRIKKYATIDIGNSSELDALYGAKCKALMEFLSFLDTLEVKEMDLEKGEEKLNKAIKLADAMYYAAQQLTTDASRLHKAMQDWWHFKNFEL